jgi:hypothetical protein
MMRANMEGTTSAITLGNTSPVQDLGCHSSVAEDSSLLRRGTMSGVLAQ